MKAIFEAIYLFLLGAATIILIMFALNIHAGIFFNKYRISYLALTPVLIAMAFFMFKLFQKRIRLIENKRGR